MKDSKKFGKIRSNIKKKNPKVKETEKVQNPGTSAKDLKAEALRRKANKNPQNNELPVLGSAYEYSKIASNVPVVQEDEDSEEEEEDDEIWGAIMGK